MLMSTRHRPPASQRGSTLVEILVTLVILLFGLLGLVGVNSRANMAELESFQRMQAVQLAQDMASRINANRRVAACYSLGTKGVILGGGLVASYPDRTSLPVTACTEVLPTPPTAITSSELALVNRDLNDWNALLLGGIEVINASGGGTSKVGAPQNAIGCITMVGTDPANPTLQVAVAWQGMAPTLEPAIDCGKGQFGSDEKLRRVVTSQVTIGNVAGITPAP
jgi:type IV pilus assembly protein PilV